jgi:hypothetical protein
MTFLGPVLDEEGAPVKTGDFVSCVYKIYAGSEIVDCAWISGAIIKIDYDIPTKLYAYRVNFKFEGKEINAWFEPELVKFRDRPPAPETKIIVKEGEIKADEWMF